MFSGYFIVTAVVGYFFNLLQLPFLVEGGGMSFDGSGEVRPGIEESCNSDVVLCEEIDDC